jgi:hypothetical protein
MTVGDIPENAIQWIAGGVGFSGVLYATAGMIIAGVVWRFFGHHSSTFSNFNAYNAKSTALFEAGAVMLFSATCVLVFGGVDSLADLVNATTTATTHGMPSAYNIIIIGFFAYVFASSVSLFFYLRARQSPVYLTLMGGSVLLMIMGYAFSNADDAYGYFVFLFFGVPITCLYPIAAFTQSEVALFPLDWRAKNPIPTIIVFVFTGMVFTAWAIIGLSTPYWPVLARSLMICLLACMVAAHSIFTFAMIATTTSFRYYRYGKNMNVANGWTRGAMAQTDAELDVAAKVMNEEASVAAQEVPVAPRRRQAKTELPL